MDPFVQLGKPTNGSQCVSCINLQGMENIQYNMSPACTATGLGVEKFCLDELPC